MVADGTILGSSTKSSARCDIPSQARRLDGLAACKGERAAKPSLSSALFGSLSCCEVVDVQGKNSYLHDVTGLED